MASSRHGPASASSPRGRKRRHRRLYERRIRGFSLLLAGPGLVIAIILTFQQAWSRDAKWSVAALLVILFLIFEAVLHDQVIRPLQTLTNVISSLREEDFSFRARGAVANDALGELATEVNALADTLSAQKTFAVEATELLKRVLEEIDTPLFTFDPNGKLNLVNSAGTRLLQQSRDDLLGRTAEDIGLTAFFQSETGVTSVSPLSPNARWLVRRTSFREKGVPHTLILLSDVSRALREEERSAWQRLIRVLGHELNNSLTPIKSIAGTLLLRVKGMEIGTQEQADFEKGLGIIESRSASLNRFLQAYRQIAQMPGPKLQPTPVRTLVERSAALENRVPVKVESGPEVTVSADPDQLEQVLINIVRNAAEAVMQAGHEAGPEAPVSIRWLLNSHFLQIQVIDSGPGLLNPENAFVPFYTTKESGSGIGLALSRHIVEAHGGSIQLLNRKDAVGCIAVISIPASREEVTATSY
jgi:two-component system, NtrC family, nitrogen regulation sensor histidine kinase NtrY